uniref:Tetraspanin 2b n=1 Tax=Cyclopterus lumpus TaxID=8103 RepID=A0A8C2ZJ53_CYCLU
MIQLQLKPAVLTAHDCGLLVSRGHIFVVLCILSEISGDYVAYYKSFSLLSLQLMGSFVLAVGLWLRFDPETVSLLNGDKAPDTFFIGVYILISAGSMVMLVGFFGCCGAVRESQCLLGSIIKDVQTFYTTTYNENNNSTLIISYQKVSWCRINHPKIITTTRRCLISLILGLQDCKTSIKEFFNSKLYIIGYVGIGIAGVMIIGMIFSMVLCCAIRNTREVI